MEALMLVILTGGCTSLNGRASQLGVGRILLTKVLTMLGPGGGGVG